jgi:Glycosyltransferases involved in cell wall biogenesis
MARFSVIIPVYKVEKYLDRCIRSVAGQTFKDLEVILIDDESPDSCPAICDAWAQKDSRIKVIHKKNGGLGFARNSGIAAATGEYISFIDSDDTVAPDMLEQLDQKLTAESMDICYFGWNRIVNGKRTFVAKMKYPPTCYGQQVRDIVWPYCFGTSWLNDFDFEIGSACFGIYKRTLFNDGQMRFESERDVLSEDILFTINLVARAQSVGFISKAFYNYYCNPASLTKSYKPNRFEKTIQFYRILCSAIAREDGQDECLIRAKSLFLAYVIGCLKQELNREADKKEMNEKFRSICSSGILHEVLRDFPLHKADKKRRLLFALIKHEQLLPVRWIIRYQIWRERV